MTNTPDVWVVVGARWVNLSRLLRELPHDRRRLLIESVEVRRRVPLAHRAIQMLRRCVGKESDDPGQVGDVLLGGLSHEPDDRAGGDDEHR